MGRNKKVMCNVCYREMRSDVLKRHMKQHSNKNEKSKINKEELRKHLIKVGNEYQKKLELGKEIYEMLNEGVVSYQPLTWDMKEAVDLYIENQADLSSEVPEQLCKDIETSTDETSMYKFNDLNLDGMDESPLSGDEIDENELEKTLVYHHNKYVKKIELGAKVCKLIKNKGIHPDSLIPTYKEALDLYMKESVDSDSDVDSNDL